MFSSNIYTSFIRHEDRQLQQKIQKRTPKSDSCIIKTLK